MNTFHLILQRFVVSLFALCFMFVAVYVPQPWNEIKKAEAVVAQDSTSWLIKAELAASYIIQKAIDYSGQLTAAATAYLQAKESILDGIAWAVAKRIVAQMTVSIVNWINSGFKGSPAFVTDLKGFMLGVADIAFGDIMMELGGPFSFICSPFKLDIKLALAISYQQARNGYPACTLTGALANLKNFASGDFISGGWDAWFSVTSNPAQYTPYGSILTAQGALTVKIAQTQDRQSKYLSYGNGFLSSLDPNCKKVSGGNDCTIVTPGKVIQDALTFQLSTGPRSLIAADEINEILGALFAQLAQQAITGTKGLLGMSSRGYTNDTGYHSGSYLGDTSAQIDNTGSSAAKLENMVNASLSTERDYLNAANLYEPRLLDYVINGATPEKQIGAKAEALSIPALRDEIIINITKLESILNRYRSGLTPLESLGQEYYQTVLHTNQEVESAIQDWLYLTTD